MQREPIYIVNEENYMCKTVLICGNCTQGGMVFFKKVALFPKYSVPRHFWYMLHTFLDSIFEICAAIQKETINFINEENYRRKTEVFWELHAWGGEVF